jgi:CheY-like chemotaxis protein
MTMRDSRPVLLVEDDTIDAMTVRRAFRDLKVTNPLVHTVNGEEALVYLRDEAKDKPCLILLDLNMPKMNGTEFLTVAKADPVLKKIPVVVLTTSSEERDVVESFRLSVAGYIIKPVDYRNFVEAIRTINVYWTLSEMPDKDAEGADAQCQTVVAGGR